MKRSLHSMFYHRFLLLKSVCQLTLAGAHYIKRAPRSQSVENSQNAEGRGHLSASRSSLIHLLDDGKIEHWKVGTRRQADAAQTRRRHRAPSWAPMIRRYQF